MQETQAYINHKARVVLESLAPAGSEFHNDPYRCAEYIQWIKTSGHEAKCEVVKMKHINTALVEALEALTSAIDLSKLKVRKDFSLLNAHASALRALAQAKGGACVD